MPTTGQVSRMTNPRKASRGGRVQERRPSSAAAEGRQYLIHFSWLIFLQVMNMNYTSYE